MRDELRGQAARRIAEWEGLLANALERVFREQQSLVISRLRGEKSRRWTRHWQPKPGQDLVVTKALDPNQVLPSGRVRASAEQIAEPVVTRIVGAALDDATRRMAPPGTAIVGLDSPAVQQAILDAVARIADVSEARAAAIRDVILDRDATDDDLEAIVRAVRGTYAQRAAWAATTARTLTAGMTNRTALLAARAAGVTTMQWLSSHDERVRETHRVADGQVRHVEDAFIVGGHRLEYPGDPSGLPETGEEVYNCRCTLLFAKPEPRLRPQAWQARKDPTAQARALRAMQEWLDTPAEGGDDGAENLGPRSAVVQQPFLAYRGALRDALPELEVGAQSTTTGEATVTLLRTVAERAGDVVVEIEVPAGASVQRDDDTITLPAGTTLVVVAVADDTVRVRVD